MDLCDQALPPLGYRAVDLDFRVGRRSLVRLFIERIAPVGATAEAPQTPGGVSLEDCALVSRTLGPLLDVRIPTAYDLEVSSPGLDRRLRLKPDFEKAVGDDVKLRLAEKLPGRGANLTGRLIRVDKDEVFVAVGRDEVPVPLGTVVQAVRLWRDTGSGPR